MKTRFDFVSNSSSCSFVVHNGKAAIREFKKLSKYNVPLCINDTNFKLYGSKEDLDKIVKQIEWSNEPSNCYDGSYELYGLPFSTILSLKASQLKNISVGADADVYDEAQALFVRLLCKMLLDKGIKVENVGDYSLALDTDDSFLLRLLKIVLDGDKKK